MGTLINGRERRLLRHLIKKELKELNLYQKNILLLTGYCRTPTSIGVQYRIGELEKLLSKLN